MGKQFVVLKKEKEGVSLYRMYLGSVGVARRVRGGLAGSAECGVAWLRRATQQIPPRNRHGGSFSALLLRKIPKSTRRFL